MHQILPGFAPHPTPSKMIKGGGGEFAQFPHVPTPVAVPPPLKEMIKGDNNEK